jgi:four helix bundle protein
MALAHEKLVAWQRADDFFVSVHRATHKFFPREEKFELGTQIRRSAYSVPANIVEGNARDTLREKLRFLNFASASLNETGYGLHAAHRLGYFSDEVYADLVTQLDAVGAPLHGLIRGKRRELALKAGSITVLLLAFTQLGGLW